MATMMHKSVSVPAAVFNVQQWLLSEGKDFRSNGALLKACASQMRQNGIPVDRFLVATMLIHPQASAWVWKWESAASEEWTEVPITKDVYDHRFEIGGDDAPMHQIEKGVDPLRIRASDKHVPENCRDQFTERGYVEMYGRRLHFRGEYGGGITWNTKHPNGWSDEHIGFLDGILPALSCVIFLHLSDVCMHSLLCTYLGKDPGNRVHHGSIQRGQGRTVRSVIWFSDIRGFTKMSGELSRDLLISIINDVFEATEKALSEHGGEVLKFMGDGLMGVFTGEGDEFKDDEFKEEGPSDLLCHLTSSEGSDGKADLCRNARAAAAQLQSSLSKMREERSSKGLPGAEVRVGIGLHYGDVSYGNIGAPSRLDFTVIGPSVNLASRVESLCGKLKVPVLATKDFVIRDDEQAWDTWKSRGKHTVKGISDPVEVFELISEDL